LLNSTTITQLPAEAGEVLRNFLEAELLAQLHQVAFLRSEDDRREQAGADRALARVSAAAIAAPGGAAPVSSPLPGRLSQLAVPPAVQRADVLRLCVAALQRMNCTASAEGKMEAVADCCAVIATALRWHAQLAALSSGGGGGGGGDVGADELLPALMWVILFAARLEAPRRAAGEAADAGAGAAAHAPLRLVANCSYVSQMRRGRVDEEARS
jgi:hypothetical protein